MFHPELFVLKTEREADQVEGDSLEAVKGEESGQKL